MAENAFFLTPILLLCISVCIIAWLGMITTFNNKKKNSISNTTQS